MPEISRFFGIIVRMYAEPGAPHHQPHFHIYYQNEAAVLALIHWISLAVALARGNDDSWRLGLSFIGPSSWKTGNGYKPGERLSRSRRFDDLEME